MTAALEDLPDDVATLRALIVAERARHAGELAERDSRLERLMAMLQALRRTQFGRRSEKLDPAQLALALEDLEIAVAAAEAEEEKHNPTRSMPRRATAAKRAPLPAHLPRVEQVLEPDSTVCPCCNGAMHPIGEDRAERLDVIPAQYRVLVTRRPKYACRACEGAVVQRPAPARLIEAAIRPKPRWPPSWSKSTPTTCHNIANGRYRPPRATPGPKAGLGTGAGTGAGTGTRPPSRRVDQ